MLKGLTMPNKLSTMRCEVINHDTGTEIRSRFAGRQSLSKTPGRILQSRGGVQCGSRQIDPGGAGNLGALHFLGGRTGPSAYDVSPGTVKNEPVRLDRLIFHCEGPSPSLLGRGDREAVGEVFVCLFRHKSVPKCRFVPPSPKGKAFGGCAARIFYFTAMASTSHRTPLGRSFTATQLRAGLLTKYCS